MIEQNDSTDLWWFLFLPATYVLGTSGIISIDTGGKPGWSARVTGPKVTSQVSTLPIFVGIYSGNRQWPSVIKLTTNRKVMFRQTTHCLDWFRHLPLTRWRTMTNAWIRAGANEDCGSRIESNSLSSGMSTTIRCQLLTAVSRLPEK